MTDNDVMQVAMSGHLLVESNLTDEFHNSAIPIRRFTSEILDNDPSSSSIIDDDDGGGAGVMIPSADFSETVDGDEDGQASAASSQVPAVPGLRLSSDSTSSLEKYFDQQFTNFQIARLPAVDWSLRSDGHDQTKTVVSTRHDWPD